jgi:hypothetical protein
MKRTRDSPELNHKKSARKGESTQDLEERFMRFSCEYMSTKNKLVSENNHLKQLFKRNKETKEDWVRYVYTENKQLHTFLKTLNLETQFEIWKEKEYK